ncbi:MAG: hypothetical protein U0575_15455 [Phycisphaerales bacterium]
MRCAPHAVAQTFTFDSGVAGWAVYDISYNGQPLSNPQPVGVPSFDANNGLAPGSLRVEDQASETWIGATSAVAGDRSGLFGVSSVSFDVYYRFTDPDVYAAIALYGAGLTLYQPHDPPALDVWLHWDFPLVAGAWRVDSILGPLATAQQIHDVLADLQGVFIHTEWKTGPDDTNVDNIAIGPCMGGGGPACCPADLDRNGVVDAADLGMLLSAWGTTGPGDLNGSGAVDAADLGLLLGSWGPC